VQAGQALEAWARGRGFRLALAEEAHPAPLAVDMSVADRVEEDLAQAREALVVADPRGAERALAHAEGELLAHPELPQAAWLLAEVERGWSMRWRRLAPMDEERAAAAWRRAEGLDDGRAAGIGETSSPPDPPVTTTLAVEGGAAVRLWLDGRAVSPGSVTRAAGRHQLVATDDGAVVSAAWVTLAAGAPLRVRLGPFSPCTFADLAAASLVPPPPGSATPSVRAQSVRCPQWIAASPASLPGALYVASCEADHCGPATEWRPPTRALAPPPPRKTVEHAGWPAWATWTLVGAGAVALTGVVLIATGAFDSSPPDPRFVSGGVKPQGAWAPLSF
jgi:hypothetical protein